MKLPHNFYRGRAITMDCHHCITESAVTQEGQHLHWKTEGYQKTFKSLGARYSCAIARASFGRARPPSPNRAAARMPKSNKGKLPVTSPGKRQSNRALNKSTCHRHPKAGVCSNFTSWVVRQIREHKWSLGCLAADMPSGSACSSQVSEWLSPHPLQHSVWKRLSIQPTELP